MKKNDFVNKFITDINNEIWKNYDEVIKNNYKTWDYIVLTSSNKQQSEIYRRMIDYRLQNNLIPKAEYIIIEDIEGKRIGSGGATLNVLKKIYEQYENLDDKKILLINSGGDSKRVPQYSSIGKIFSPVQRILPNGIPSTLFDENVILSTSLFYRINKGCLIMAGDVLLNFNPMQVDFFNRDIASVSISEDVATGCHHGVFVTDSNKRVLKFLHKQSIENLKKFNAINSNNKVDIDTGIMFISSNVISDLLSIIKDENNEKIFISDNTRLNLYNDFLIPCAKESTKDNYMNSDGEIELNENIFFCRKILWEVLNKYEFYISKLSPSKFTHYGTTSELLTLLSSNELDFLNFSNKILTNIEEKIDYNIYKSYIGENAQINSNCYIENSIVGENTVIGSDTILSSVVCKEVEIPSNVVLNTLRLKNNKYVTRIYGIKDNPKDSYSKCINYLSQNLNDFLNKTNISPDIIWNSEEKTLWNANLFIESDTNEESIKNSLKLYSMINGNSKTEEIKEYFSKPRTNLRDSYNLVDNSYYFELIKEIEIQVEYENYLKNVEERISSTKTNSEIEKSLYKDEIVKKLIKKKNKSFRLARYLSELDIIEKNDLKEESNMIIKNIQKMELKSENKIITKDISEYSLPIRVNFGGGWTDTIPYCIENGGSVFNGAFLLNNEKPIKCRVEKTIEKKLILRTIDLNQEKTIKNVEEVLECNQEIDDFSLLKAALIVTGFIDKNDKSLNDFYNRINGGLILTTYVKDIPKGSGLGTSSILAICCLKTLYDFKNVDIDLNELNKKTLLLEQLIGTGGGWQDQIGGIVPGLKLITTNPGIEQNVNVDSIEINDNIKYFFNERFMLIFTGQRRAAKTLVKNIMGEYILSNKKIVDTLNKIKDISKKMFISIKNEEFDKFCYMMNEHWKLSSDLDENSINKSIELIIDSIDDLIDSKMICGAGGGGFIQIVIKENYQKQDIINRIESIFEDCGVKCYETKIEEK